MVWFTLAPGMILPFATAASAYQYAIEQSLAIHKVQKLRFQHCSANEFSQLLEQVIHYCQQGHSLQSALLQQPQHGFKGNSLIALTAIQTLLARGYGVAETLSYIAPVRLHALINLIPEKGTEESKLLALEIIQQALVEEQTLSTQLTKSLLYPFAVIQSALALAIANAWLTHSAYQTLVAIWLIISVLQSSTYLLLKRGYAYPLVTHYCQSFRIQNLLCLLEALLRCGDPLQIALKKLNTNHPAERLSIYKAILKLQNGHSVEMSLPAHWFIGASKPLLACTPQTGDINSALSSATQEWKERSQKALGLMSKLAPIVGMMIAAVFVGYALLTLYAPLMEANHFAL